MRNHTGHCHPEPALFPGEGSACYYGQGHLHFITFSCYHRLPLLETACARDVFVKELGEVRDEMQFHLIGCVVMPEHVHLLLSEPQRGTPSTLLHNLKVSRSPENAPANETGQRGTRGIVRGYVAPPCRTCGREPCEIQLPPCAVSDRR